MRKILWISIISFLFSICSSSAQNNNQQERLKVFIDCQTMCDFDFIRNEVKFVDYVNDRYVANVYILVTSSSTGGGGREYKLYFEGLQKFKSQNDTLTYIRTAVETGDEDRRKMIQILKLGLMRYVARTSSASNIQITMQETTGEK